MRDACLTAAAKYTIIITGKKKAVPGARYGSCIERRKNGIG
jgi:hypothetical protein